MSEGVWVTIVIVTVVYFGWLIYEVKNAPIMPDDYDINEEENNKDGNSND
jgi:hypothetical protein